MKDLFELRYEITADNAPNFPNIFGEFLVSFAFPHIRRNQLSN